MANQLFTYNEKIEMFVRDYLSNLNFQNVRFRKQYLSPLANHFDFFNKNILKVLKDKENKDKMNLVCSGLFVLSRNIDFIFGNEFENQLIEVIKDLDINKKAILKSLVLFSGVVISGAKMYELSHKHKLNMFRMQFKKALKELELHEKIKIFDKWSASSLEWNYTFGINNKSLSHDPKGWFLSLIK